MNWKKIRVVVGWGLAGFLALGAMFHVQVGRFIFSRQIAKQTPVVYKMPVELTDFGCSDPRGVEVSRFGVNFRVPWSSLKGSRVSGSVALFYSHSGVILSFFDPSTVPDGPQTMLSEGPETIQHIFGDAVSSNYNFKKAILEATPDKVRLFDSKANVIRESTLLVFKSIELSNRFWNFYSFSVGDLRGFQIGGLDDGERESVHIFSFDAKDNQFEFILSSEKDTPGALTQSDVNCFLAGLADLTVDSDD